MNTKTLKVSIVGALMVWASSGLAQTAPKVLPKSKGVTSSRAALGPREENPSGPLSEPADSYSAQLRREQVERKIRRDTLDWFNVDSSVQEILWDYAVGPDQINDGTGHALLRPSERVGAYEGRDGYGPRDLLVTFSWLHTGQIGNPPAAQLYDMSLNVDGDIVLAGGYDDSSAVKVTEVKGTNDATQGWFRNWDTSFTWGGAVDPSLYACAADLNGNTYASGTQGKNTYPFFRLDGDTGANSLAYSFSASTLTTGTSVTDMALDAEGMIYICGNSLDDTGKVRWFIAKHKPVAPYTRQWITYLPGAGKPDAGIKVNRYGEVFVGGGNSPTGGTNKDFTVVKVSNYDGVIEWTVQDVQTGNESAKAMVLDFAGNPYVTGTTTTGCKTLKIDRSTGAIVWNTSYPTGTSVDLAIDSNSNVYIVGNESATAKIRTIKYNGNGVQQWVRGYGTTGAGGAKVALDWIGNPYVVGTYGSGSPSIDLRKLDPTNGSDVWAQAITPNYDANETTTNTTIGAMVVDAGGSVYVGGNRTGTRSGVNGGVLFVGRWEQPFQSIPQIAKSNPFAKLSERSVWAPTLEGSQTGYSNTFSIFSKSLSSLVPESTLDSTLQKELFLVVDQVKGVIDVNYINNPTFGVDFVAQATGGTFDATMTGNLSIAVPGEGELVASTPFDVAIEFEPDPGQVALSTDGLPVLTAKFVTNVTGNISAQVRGYNSALGLPYEQTYSYTLPTPSLSSLDNKTIYDFMGPLNSTPVGTWETYSDNYVNVSARKPPMRAKGVYSTNVVSGTSSGSNADDDTVELDSSLTEKFADATVSATNVALALASLPPLSEGYAQDFGGGSSFDVYAGLLQLLYDGNVSVQQDINVSMKPYVRLTFPGASPAIADKRIPLAKRTTSSGKTVFVPEPGVNTTVTLPSTGNLEIKPYFGVSSKVTNTSGLLFDAGFAFETFRSTLNLSVIGINIFDEDYCLGCPPRFDVLPNNAGAVTLWNDVAPTSFDWPEVELASLQLSGDPSNEPELIGASRASAPMIIYDQHNPSQANLNSIASGTEPMILYGRKFFTGVGGNKAFIRHNGRTEQLSATRLNDQSLLIQVPKRFYLLPGVARLWVTNNNGKTKSIDFPIEYPFPNFVGVQGLDGANDPEIWAGDPRRVDTGLVPIDGGTPAGNDSFITRRDYYTVLRTNWSSGLFAVGESGSGLTAQAYFPGFNGWELAGSPKTPPGFPTLMFDGTALARLTPAINDGDYRAIIQPDLYSSPRVSTLQLFNPAPGGGPSRSRTITIPAPKPVISGISPSAVLPGSVAAGTTLRVVVSGPDSVPYFAGYEKAKAGNFTPESVVLIDGTPVTTKFQNSGRLIAEVPSTYFDTANKTRLITVSTPGNGTTYTEQLKTGGGTLNAATTENSGGTSVAMPLEVTWPRPVITALSASSLKLGVPPAAPVTVNGGAPPDTHNFGITGQNFAPGCTVYWNGRVIPSTRASDQAIRVTVSAQEVAAVGAARVWVTNPPPALRASPVKSVTITP